MGGPTPSSRASLSVLEPILRPIDPAGGVYETITRLTTETSGGNTTATPLRLSIFPTFLGELDSRLLGVSLRWLLLLY